MLHRIKKILIPKPQTMNTIVISKKNILYNLKILQHLQNTKHIFPVLKSNAYGHGIQQIVQILNKTKTKYICVDSFPEYQIVKNHSKKNILLIGETLPTNYKFFDPKRTTFCVYNHQTIEKIGKINKKIKIHLFLNTGMNREGIQYKDLDAILELISKYPKIIIEGVMSHFYDADINSSESNLEQIKIFKQAYHKIIEYGHTPKYKHIANSAGFIRKDEEEMQFFNASRIGISLYGYSPFPKKEVTQLPKKIQKQIKKLKPALSINSILISKHQIKNGEGVSYHHTFKNTNESLTVGTIPFGYEEGLPKIASENIFFKKNNTKLEQIGTICMNLSSCLIPDELKIHEKINIIDIKGENTIENLAEKTNMSTYEILVGLNKNIRRIIS